MKLFTLTEDHTVHYRDERGVPMEHVVPAGTMLSGYAYLHGPGAVVACMTPWGEILSYSRHAVPEVQPSTCKHCGKEFTLTSAEREEVVKFLGAVAVDFCTETCFVRATFPPEEVEDARVTAIRLDSEVGQGTCSIVDETYTDAELVEELDREGITTPEDAVRWAREAEEV